MPAAIGPKQSTISPSPSGAESLYREARNERLALSVPTTVATFGTGAVAWGLLTALQNTRNKPSIFLRYAPCALPVLAGLAWAAGRAGHQLRYRITPPESKMQTVLHETLTYGTFAVTLTAHARFLRAMANANPARPAGKVLKLSAAAWAAICDFLHADRVLRAYPAMPVALQVGAQAAAAYGGIELRMQHAEYLNLPITDTNRPTQMDWSKVTTAKPEKVVPAGGCFVLASAAIAAQTAEMLPKTGLFSLCLRPMMLAVAAVVASLHPLRPK